MTPSDPSETPLSQADFIRLLVKNEPVLRLYARTLLPDWKSVDDVLQEASVTLWEKFSQLRDEAGFLPWAKTVVRFKALSAIDRLRRDRHVFSDRVLELLAQEAEAFEAEERERSLRALRSCLEGFTPEHRELLLAPYFGEGRVITLAEQAGKSANALYKLLTRLREKLLTCVQTRLSEEAT
jgi:RNA polymerase sigma-70 factor (ECF subfamily)